MKNEDNTPKLVFTDFYGTEQAATRELLNSDHFDVGFVLKCHLIAEQALTRFLIQVKGLRNLEKCRLTFAQKVEIVDELDFIASYKAGLKELNRTRNDFSHDLGAQLKIDKNGAIDKFTKAFIGSTKKAQKTVRKELVEKFGIDGDIVDYLMNSAENRNFERSEEGKITGESLAHLSAEEPREMMANYVASFCDLVAIAIFRERNTTQNTSNKTADEKSDDR